MIMLTPQKAAIQYGVGALKVSLTVCVSTACAFSIAWNPTTPGDPVAGSMTYCQLKTTSSAVNGLPSCHVTPRLRRHVTDRPSRASRPLATVGMSSASTGMRLPSASYEASGSKKMREASQSFVPTASRGLSRVDACQLRILSAPPPPRFFGVNVGCAAAGATPTDASIWPASGAAIPSAIMCSMNHRRVTRPSVTSFRRARRSCSFMLAPHRAGSSEWTTSGAVVTQELRDGVLDGDAGTKVEAEGDQSPKSTADHE